MENIRIAAYILAVIVILETIALLGIFYVGLNEVGKENLCAAKCEAAQGYSYLYSNGICKCNTEEGIKIIEVAQ
jgi:hypothetical protein